MGRRAPCGNKASLAYPGTDANGFNRLSICCTRRGQTGKMHAGAVHEMLLAGFILQGGCVGKALNR